MEKKLLLLFLTFHIGYLSCQEKRTKKEIDSITDALWSARLFDEERLLKFTELYYQAKEIDYGEGQVKLLTKIADLKAGRLDFKGALDVLKTLKSLSLSIGAYDSYISGSGVEAKILWSDHNYSEAQKILYQAQKYLPKIQDKEKRRKAKIEIYIYLWYCVENSKIPMYSYRDSLLSISKKMYKEAILIENDKHRANRILFSANLIMNSLILLKKYEEASLYVKIAKDQISKVSEETFIVADYYEAKGDIEYNYKSNKNYSLDLALASYNKAITIGEKLNYTAKTKELYSKVAKIYGEKKNKKSQVLFLEKSQILKDSIWKREAKALNEVKPTLYTVSKKETIEEEESPKNKIIIHSMLTFFLVLLVGVGIGTKKFKRKKSNKAKINKSEIAFEEDSLLKSKSYNNLINLALNNDPSFYLIFLEIYQDFGEKLLKINPMIKVSDIEFCAYIKVNLDTKQIAKLKKMSVRAVEGKKYRIRKKLNISLDQDMYIWLSEL